MFHQNLTRYCLNSAIISSFKNQQTEKSRIHSRGGIRLQYYLLLLKNKYTDCCCGDPENKAECVFLKPSRYNEIYGRNKSEDLRKYIGFLSLTVEQIPVVQRILIKRRIVAKQGYSEIVKRNIEPECDRACRSFDIEKSEVAADYHSVSEHTVHHTRKIVQEEGHSLCLCKVVLNVTSKLGRLKITGIGDGNAENTAEKMLPEALEDRTDNGNIF